METRTESRPEPPTPDYHPFDHLKARYVIPLFIVPMIGVYYPANKWISSDFWYLFVTSLASMALAFMLLLLYAYHKRLDFKRLLGPPIPSATYFRLSYRVMLPLIAVALASITLIYLPMSYIWPEFVKFMIIDDSGSGIFPSGDKTISTYLVSFFVVVLLGPVFEEFLMRGLLFHRFARKWGTVTGVVLSSILFGILHSDLIGATIFGVVRRSDVSHLLKNAFVVGAYRGTHHE